MRSLFKRAAVAVVLTFPVAALGTAGHAAWIKGNGLSCDQACTNAGWSPLISGYYNRGHPFYVCAGNARKEGLRGGYNLRPKWSRYCVVGWGGKEVFETDYVCLCQRGGILGKRGLVR
jgi:hypothetical protein